MNKLILNSETVFKDAIALLDDNGNGVLPVVDESNKFIGLITDGDIRKAILNNYLDLEHIINKKPYSLNCKSTQQQRIQYLKKLLLRHLPLVDDDGQYVETFTLDNIDFNLKPNSVLIMAGGLGSRLGQLTEVTPKPMLSIGRKPMLEAMIESFIEHGYSKFYLSVNYKKEKIIDHFSDGKKWGVEIVYLVEDKRLGTGGALSLIEDKLEAPIIVINGDILTTLDFGELVDFHNQSGSNATMCVMKHETNFPYGVVRSEGTKLVALDEKPVISHNINTGIYVLNPDVLEYVPKDEYFDLPDLFKYLIDDDKDVGVYELTESWVDIGHVDDYERMEKVFDL